MKFKDFLNEADQSDLFYDTMIDNAEEETGKDWKRTKDESRKIKGFYKIETKACVKSKPNSPNSGVNISYDGKKWTCTEYVDEQEKSYSFSEEDEDSFWGKVAKYFN